MLEPIREHVERSNAELERGRLPDAAAALEEAVTTHLFGVRQTTFATSPALDGLALRVPLHLITSIAAVEDEPPARGDG